VRPVTVDDVLDVFSNLAGNGFGDPAERSAPASAQKHAASEQAT
jgi:hypothetical protein